MIEYEKVDAENIHELPKVETKEVRLLWHSSYWDGPVDGLLIYKGRKYWFEMLDDGEVPGDVRRFLIIELSPAELDEEERWHELFRAKVGMHCDYDEAGKARLGELRPKEMWSEFYAAYDRRKPRQWSGNRVIAWFEG